MKIVLIALLTALAALAAAGYAVFRVACVRPKVHPKPIEENVSPLWADYQEEVVRGVRWFCDQKTETVELTSCDGLRLRGKYLPHENARGTMLLFHGYRSDGYTDFSCAYEFYNSLGYSILSVFQRAHGESEGRYICYGLKERYDCRDWAWYAYRRFGADHPLFLSGISMGSSTVLMATGLSLPPTVRGVVADCGFTSPWEELWDLLGTKFRPVRRPLLWMTNLYTRVFAGFGLREYSTLDAMRQTHLPILFVHGEEDHFVSPRFSRENFEACASPEKELVLVPGATHGVSYLVDKPRCQKTLGRFLISHTEKEGDPC